MIFDLDSFPIKEVESIENIDSFMDPNTTINTGFIMSTSKTKEDDDENKYLFRNQLFTNEHVNLLFQKKQSRMYNRRSLYISGMLYRTFSEIDLFALKEISNSVNARQKFPKTDHHAYLCTYEGHTVFSIFFDTISVYEEIHKQFSEIEF